MRPQCVTDWIRSKKKNTIPDISFDSAVTQVLKWWQAMCPCPDDASAFASFCKGGTSGIYTLVVPLAWCLSTCDKTANEANQEQLWQTIGVIGQILGSTSQSGSAAETKKTQRAPKRSVTTVEGGSEQGSRKRYVILFFHHLDNEV